jgi:outer membrane protein assembly factor BamB
MQPDTQRSLYLMKSYSSFLIIYLSLSLAAGNAGETAPKSAAGAGLAATPWPKQLGSAGNTSVSGFPGAQHGRLRWRRNLAGLAEPSELLETVTVGVGGAILVATGNGLDAFDELGNHKWRYGRAVGTAPTVDSNGLLYAGLLEYSPKAGIVCVAPSGVERWFQPTKNRILSAPNIDAVGTVYIGCLDSLIYALPRGSTRNSYQVKTGHYVRATPVVGAEDVVTITSLDQHIYRLQAGGSRIDRLTATNVSFCYETSPVLAPDGTLYLMANESGKWFLVALDPRMRTLWKFETDGCSEPPSVAKDGLVVVRNRAGVMSALDRNGTLSWTLEIPQQRNGQKLYNPVIGSDGKMYTAFQGGNELLCLAPTGKLRWSLNVGDTIVSRPIVGPGASIIVNTRRYLLSVE